VLIRLTDPPAPPENVSFDDDPDALELVQRCKTSLERFQTKRPGQARGLRRAINQLESASRSVRQRLDRTGTGPPDSDDDAPSREVTLQDLVHLPAVSQQDWLQKEGSLRRWTAFARFAIDNGHSLCNLGPPSTFLRGSACLTTLEALSLLREHLRVKLRVVLASSNLYWPRVGLLPTRERRRDGTVIVCTDRSRVAEQPPHHLGAGCMVWIASQEAVTCTLARRDDVRQDEVYALGALRFVQSVGMSGGTITVAPRLSADDLPRAPDDDVVRPTKVFVLLMRDVFEFRFLYEAMRSVAAEYDAGADGEPRHWRCAPTSAFRLRQWREGHGRHPKLWQGCWGKSAVVTPPLRLPRLLSGWSSRWSNRLCCRASMTPSTY
jgi:hypothetical protein